MLFAYQHLSLRVAFPFRFSHRTLHAARPLDLILLDFIALITFGDECNHDACRYVILVRECIIEYQEAV